MVDGLRQFQQSPEAPPLESSDPGESSRGYATETELSKLIRYGCKFELEVHQMVELNLLRDPLILLTRG